MHTFDVPIAQSKSAALTRVLDLVSRNYTHFTCGQIQTDKLMGLVPKLHERHAIGATPSQRITRKKNGMANAALVLYDHRREEREELCDHLRAEKLQWMLLFTTGELQAHEQLLPVLDKKQSLQWLGYELTRYSTQGAVHYTWRRPKQAMEDFYNALDELLKRRNWAAVDQLLKLTAKQPGFHGIREQGLRLQQFAKEGGHVWEMPHLFYLEKISHGPRVQVVIPDKFQGSQVRCD